MANLKILHDKPTDAGTYSGGSWAASLPLANLQSRQVTQVARSTNTLAASTKFVIDMGRPFSISQMVLLSHNLSGPATIRWRLSDSAGGSPASYDATTPAIMPTIPWGSLPWGVFPWDGVDPASASLPGGQRTIHFMPASVFARYVLIDISDAGNADGYVQAGRFLAGDPWSPAINMNWGAQVGYIDDSKGRRSRGGQIYFSEAQPRRQMALTFEALTEAEAMTALDVMRKIGLHADLFVTYDSDDVQAVLFQRAIYGSLVKLDPTSHQFVDRYGWSAAIEELI